MAEVKAVLCGFVAIAHFFFIVLLLLFSCNVWLRREVIKGWACQTLHMRVGRDYGFFRQT
jgi:hypothetical protein